MNFIRHIAAIASATAMFLGATPSWAESGVPDPGSFFSTFPQYDPKATGISLTGTLTISYIFLDSLACEDPQLPGVPGLMIENMYVVLTLSGNKFPATPFNDNFKKHGDPGTPVFCFSTGNQQQVNFVLSLVASQVVPRFFNCTPGGCPDFKVKSITNFQSTGQGAVSMNIVFAVK